MPETKSFDIQAILTVTTGRMLAWRPGTSGGGHDPCDLLSWMTGRETMTHTYGRAADQCRPWLLHWFPELAPASVAQGSLDGWLATDRTGGQEAVEMWLAEQKMMWPAILDRYDVPTIPREPREALWAAIAAKLSVLLGPGHDIIMLDAMPQETAR